LFFTSRSNVLTRVLNTFFLTARLCRGSRESFVNNLGLLYRSIPELKEYILIDQYQYHVMQYVKTAEGQWLFTELESISATLKLQSIDVQIIFNELYEQVNFAESGEEN
jgi:hypothetical protein